MPATPNGRPHAHGKLTLPASLSIRFDQPRAPRSRLAAYPPDVTHSPTGEHERKGATMGAVNSSGGLGVRARQALFVGAGLIAAIVMLTLGLWQAQRSIESGEAGIAARAAEAPVPLLEHVHPDGTFDDIYGKRVYVDGTYLAEQQLLVPGSDGTYRVLTALQVPDGRVVPVVRGVVSNPAAIPPPPTGTQRAAGIFLPGEGEVTGVTADGQIGSVRMPLLAQRWPQQVTPGFITLDADSASAQGLAPASVTLPKGEGSLQNGSYALQWWVFAAFALGMGIKLAHGTGERERRAREDADRASLAAATGTVAGASGRETEDADHAERTSPGEQERDLPPH